MGVHYHEMRWTTDDEVIARLNEAGLVAERSERPDEHRLIPARDKKFMRLTAARCTRCYLVTQDSSWAAVLVFSRQSWYPEQAGFFDELPEGAELFVVWASTSRLRERVIERLA